MQGAEPARFAALDVLGMGWRETILWVQSDAAPTCARAVSTEWFSYSKYEDQRYHSLI